MPYYSFQYLSVKQKSIQLKLINTLIQNLSYLIKHRIDCFRLEMSVLLKLINPANKWYKLHNSRLTMRSGGSYIYFFCVSVAISQWNWTDGDNEETKEMLAWLRNLISLMSTEAEHVKRYDNAYSMNTIFYISYCCAIHFNGCVYCVCLYIVYAMHSWPRHCVVTHLFIQFEAVNFQIRRFRFTI